MELQQKGTGAVNAEGKVLLFVAAADWRPFSEFTMLGDVISLVSEEGTHSRSYGKLTVDAARRTGTLIALRVDEAGKPSGILELGARRGR